MEERTYSITDVIESPNRAKYLNYETVDGYLNSLAKDGDTSRFDAFINALKHGANGVYGLLLYGASDVMDVKGWFRNELGLVKPVKHNHGSQGLVHIVRGLENMFERNMLGSTNARTRLFEQAWQTLSKTEYGYIKPWISQSVSEEVKDAFKLRFERGKMSAFEKRFFTYGYNEAFLGTQIHDITRCVFVKSFDYFWKFHDTVVKSDGTVLHEKTLQNMYRQGMPNITYQYAKVYVNENNIPFAFTGVESPCVSIMNEADLTVSIGDKVSQGYSIFGADANGHIVSKAQIIEETIHSSSYSHMHVPVYGKTVNLLFCKEPSEKIIILPDNIPVPQGNTFDVFQFKEHLFYKPNSSRNEMVTKVSPPKEEQKPKQTKKNENSSENDLTKSS